MRPTRLLGDQSDPNVSPRRVPVDAASWTHLSCSQESMQSAVKENRYAMSIFASEPRRGTFRRRSIANKYFLMLTTNWCIHSSFPSAVYFFLLVCSNFSLFSPQYNLKASFLTDVVSEWEQKRSSSERAAVLELILLKDPELLFIYKPFSFFFSEISSGFMNWSFII